MDDLFADWRIFVQDPINSNMDEFDFSFLLLEDPNAWQHLDSLLCFINDNNKKEQIKRRFDDIEYISTQSLNNDEIYSIGLNLKNEMNNIISTYNLNIQKIEDIVINSDFNDTIHSNEMEIITNAINHDDDFNFFDIRTIALHEMLYNYTNNLIVCWYVLQPLTDNIINLHCFFEIWKYNYRFYIDKSKLYIIKNKQA